MGLTGLLYRTFLRTARKADATVVRLRYLPPTVARFRTRLASFLSSPPRLTQAQAHDECSMTWPSGGANKILEYLEEDAKGNPITAENTVRQAFREVRDEEIDSRLDATFAALRELRNAVEALEVCSAWDRIVHDDKGIPLDGSDSQVVEAGALLISKIIQNSSSFSNSDKCHSFDAVRELDAIADQCRKDIIQAYPLPASQTENSAIAACHSPALKQISTQQHLEVINKVLFNELGYSRVAAEKYYDPEFSCISTVLRERQGIPISMGVVYMAVARRLGLQVHGVNMPMRFLVGVQMVPKEAHHDSGTESASKSDDRLFVDVFDGGTIWSADDVISRLRGLQQQHSMLGSMRPDTIISSMTPMDPRNIWRRMVANLMESSKVRGDLEKTTYWLGVMMDIPQSDRIDDR